MAKKEKEEKQQTNCLSCNKPLKKKKRYYRDNKYYCGKRCYKKFIEKSQGDAKAKDEDK